MKIINSNHKKLNERQAQKNLQNLYKKHQNKILNGTEDVTG